MNLIKAVVAIFCLFAHLVLNLEAMGTVLKYPEPPKNLNNPAEVHNYLRKVHNYYIIIGRPRFELISILDKYLNYLLNFEFRFGKRNFLDAKEEANSWKQ